MDVNVAGSAAGKYSMRQTPDEMDEMSNERWRTMEGTGRGKYQPTRRFREAEKDARTSERRRYKTYQRIWRRGAQGRERLYLEETGKVGVTVTVLSRGGP